MGIGQGPWLGTAVKVATGEDGGVFGMGARYLGRGLGNWEGRARGGKEGLV